MRVLLSAIKIPDKPAEVIFVQITKGKFEKYVHKFKVKLSGNNSEFFLTETSASCKTINKSN